MPVVKIIEHFPSAENYEVGQEYDITNVDALIAEGKVELVDQPQEATTEPVAEEPQVTEGSAAEGAEEAPVEVETPVEEVEAPVEEAPAEAPVEEETPTETPAAPEETPTETETVE